MPIFFKCPHCGAETDVAEEYAGQSGPCAECGRTVTVPPPSGTPGHATPAKSSCAPLVIVLIVVAALIMLLLCGGVFFVWSARVASTVVQPTATVSVQSSGQVQCQNHLRQIGMAMHSYHQANGWLPPAYVADEDGKPKHSWRVLLLPYLGRQDLYDAYNFEEPWDSPGNQALANMMPEFYGCPDDPRAPGVTSYVMIVGPETISDGPTKHRLQDVTDGTDNTILVVETAESGINWLQPQDLAAEEISSFRLNDGTGTGIRSFHGGGVNVLFCSGSVRLLGEEIDPQDVQRMSTIAGGEAISTSFD